MTNIVKKVWKTIDNSPCIQRNMYRGLINSRALAKYIIKEKKIDATIDAVISAIRRYELNQYEELFTTAQNMIIQTVNLSTRSQLAGISLIKDTDTQKILPKLFNIIQYVRGDVLRIIQANESIKILIDEKNMENVLDLFSKDKIVTIDKELAEINMHIHPKMQITLGVLATITNELTINGINIVDAITCSPEMLWFVKEEDLLKAYNVLYQLCKSNKTM